ncbi:MAG: radical SAM/SPASM domain-containing protein [archaeon]
MTKLSFFHGQNNSVIYNWDIEKIKYTQREPSEQFQEHLKQGKKLPENLKYLKEEYPNAKLKKKIQKPEWSKFRIIHFELTENCNLRCIHCYGDFPKPGNPVTLKKYTKTLEKLRKIAETPALQLIGGEPTLLDNLEQYIEKGKKYAQHVQIFTNGYDISRNKLEKFKEAGLDKIRVTLFSSHPKIHDKITQVEDSWKNTVRTIENSIDLNIPISVETPILKENYKTREETKKFIKKKGIKNRQCNVIDAGRGEGFSPENKTEKVEEVKVPSKKVRISKYYDNCLYRRIAIHPDLTYSSCLFMGSEILGNISKQTEKQIKKSLEKGWAKYKPDNLEDCGECEFKYFCERCRPRAEEYIKKENYCGYSPSGG